MNRRLSSPAYPVLLVLSVLVLAVYWQVGSHGFVAVDDREYVYGNPVVSGGLTPEGVSWAFTRFASANWHPVTWLSHMADVQLFGLAAGWHHRTNLLIHLLNTTLLFTVLRGMTAGADDDGVWPSALAAALFGVHPLHVESVAWIAERKDLLCALFFILTVGAYRRYVLMPGAGRYVPVLALHALALMSKPMAVTLPFVLLLLDRWPLRRTELPVFRRVLEKLPLFGMSAASCVVTWLAQSAGGAVAAAEIVPFGMRLSNALVSCATYLVKTVWPSGLAIFYPHPVMLHAGIPAWRIVGSALLVGGLSLAAFLQRRRRPYLAVGWLWYLGTLAPVLGLVQVGSAAMADRYTYLPLIGIFVAASWGVREAAAGRTSRRAAAACAGVVLAALSAAAWSQAGYWQDNYTLYSRAVDVAGDNWIARKGLGVGYADRGRYPQAVAEFTEALRLKPDDPDGWDNLGKAQAGLGRISQAIGSFREAVRLAPDHFDAWYNLGNALLAAGMAPAAAQAYDEAVRLAPGFTLAWSNRGVALAGTGDHSGAIASYREALRRDDKIPEAWNNLGNAYRATGRNGEAAEAYRRALALRPDAGSAWYGLGLAARATGDEAVLREACDRLSRIDPSKARQLAAEAAAGGAPPPAAPSVR